jgi:hypothetical protein
MLCYDEALCCGNNVNFVIFVKSHCLNSMTDSKNYMKMVVNCLCAREFQIMTLEKCF